LPAQTRISEVLKQLDELGLSALNSDQLMRGIVRILQSRMLKYNWVGFYMLDSSSPFWFSVLLKAQ
jgi:putative methionine-R-sulfoxide reductase with GAF domain